MKTYKNLYDNFLSDENILLAIHNAAQNKRKRASVQWYLNNPEKGVIKIRRYASHFYNMPHRPVQIYDGITRKKRVIIVPTFKEQVVHHMIVNILKPIIMRPMYEHSNGSIPDRGAHKAKRQIEKWIKRDHEGTTYVLKMDIKKYFDSVPHDTLIQMLERKIKDERFMEVLRTLIGVTESGIPLGFYTSQWFANFYLTDLDHYIKEQLGAKYYTRYMDDMVVFDSDKAKLHEIRREVEKYLNERLGLRLKENWQVFPLEKRPLDFMGFKFFPSRTTLRKSILRKCRRKAYKLGRKDKITVYDCRQIMSYLGWLGVTCTYNYYLKYIKPFVDFGYCKRRISNFDKRKEVVTYGLEMA